MSVLFLALRYILNRPLVSFLTIFGVALGAALVSGVLTLRSETRRTFVEGSHSFDMIVGAKGSPLQMTLSSLYHLDVPTGNIPYELYEEVRDDYRVRTAIPIGLGDNYQGFRLIGTNNDMFAAQYKAMNEDPVPLFEIDQGRMNFDVTDEHRQFGSGASFDAILGSAVASKTGLGLGDQFLGTHGVMQLAGSETHDAIPYTVVGILEQSGSPSDRAIFIPIEGVWAAHAEDEAYHRKLFSGSDSGGEAEDADEAEEESTAAPGWAFAPQPVKVQREVTAVLVQLYAVGTRFQYLDEINEETDGMGAVPIQEMLRLYTQILAPVEKSLLAVAWLVVVVATLSVLTSLYQAGERRRRDIAIMRSLGAWPGEVFLIVMIESAIITLGGVILGAFMGHGILAIVRDQLFLSAGLDLQPWTVSTTELQALGVIVIAGLLAGLVPSFMAYRSTPVRDLQKT